MLGSRNNCVEDDRIIWGRSGVKNRRTPNPVAGLLKTGRAACTPGIRSLSQNPRQATYSSQP